MKRTWPNSWRRLVPEGRLRATTDYAEAIPDADVVVVVVPLFVDRDGEPDFEWMDSATADIATHLTRGTLVVYETTLPVGTTRHRWKPALEQGSGLTEGEDFHLVFSPERVLTGRVFEDLRKYPKLIGGLSPEGAKAAERFYEAVLDFDERADLARGNGVWDLGSAEAAEMAKLAETTYRDVNIALANQFALFAAGRRHRRLPGDRGLELPALQPHPPARHRRWWALHPGLPAAVPVQRPGGHRRAGRARGQRCRCHDVPWTCSAVSTAT